ncbi:zinc finger protein 711 [Eurytemora carolleeae]|uniref:zinc finger protein 711 n=1 Tax=Eurytemora carolleeae TaxID=1294199 RepID=UPI000C762FC4|nr:zinc finger protein 711 [Eurytemora carolleeae]|eukprot:XP_023326608.1 zinc finger protein 711-like [Eurytemora affinis]
MIEVPLPDMLGYSSKHSKKSSQCPHCGREFTNLKHHINQQHSQVKNYECGDCGYSCYLKTDLERHILNVHDKQRSPCPICGKSYSDLRQHIRLVHEGHKLQCPECNKKYTNLSQHISKVHKKSRNLMCEKCGNVFSSPAQLKKHEKDQH